MSISGRGEPLSGVESRCREVLKLQPPGNPSATNRLPNDDEAVMPTGKINRRRSIQTACLRELGYSKGGIWRTISPYSQEVREENAALLSHYF
jgi:hypothetical protein